jgi:hypothetical protein
MTSDVEFWRQEPAAKAAAIAQDAERLADRARIFSNWQSRRLEER